MSRHKPPPVRLCELVPDQQADFFALLSERSRSATREGKPYFNCKFRDARRAVGFMVWSDGPWYEACVNEWREGQFFKIRATYGEHDKYGPQIEVQNIRYVTDADKENGFAASQFVQSSRHDPEAMFAELHEIARAHIADDSLRKLVLSLLDRHGEAIKRAPASLNKFHPFIGGLLEHTLSVTKCSLWLVERYAEYYTELRPPLNKELVAAAAILHDIGRVGEIDDNILKPEQTVPGRMLGHLILGRDLVRDAAREQGDVNPELLQMLEHIILTHLTLPEWGSPRLPLVPECLILHHADDLDAKLEMYTRCLSHDQEPGPFTARDPVLGKQLFKGRTV
jgi:3'-5' exoribonuclease